MSAAEVDAWFAASGHRAAGALQRAREIILSADDRITETVKWKVPTFVYKGNMVSFTASKSAIGLMFHRGAELPGEHPRLGGDGRLVRTMRFADIDEVEAASGEIRHAVKAWCDLQSTV